ncbi:MAG TPA: CHRD domain-containing protein [Candidatus Binatia bacterium]|nr:CHRD domain-containing protein [Candidatus Binatia bacterium]
MKTMKRLGLGSFVWMAVIALAAATIALTHACGSDDDNKFVANMTGGEEVPPVDATGTGFAQFKFRNNDTEIDYEISQSGLVAVLFAHIHVGDPGVNGPIIFNLALAPFTDLSGTLTSADLLPAPAMGISNFSDAVNAIKAGNTYANIHTAAHPGGEVRGQIHKK